MMPKATFFSRVGLFVDEAFLDAEECAALRAEMASATLSAMAGTTTGGVDTVDVQARSTKLVEVSKATRSFIKERLTARLPQVEQHYGVTLAGVERPQFLIYREGDFFHLHTDSDTDHEAHEYARNRQVSVVLFLNGVAEAGVQEAGAGSFEGGRLTLYDLLDGPMWKGKGFELDPAPGLLFSFPSETPHEVKPVTRGERYTVVTWYH